MHAAGQTRADRTGFDREKSSVAVSIPGPLTLPLSSVNPATVSLNVLRFSVAAIDGDDVRRGRAAAERRGTAHLQRPGADGRAATVGIGTRERDRAALAVSGAAFQGDEIGTVLSPLKARPASSAIEPSRLPPASISVFPGVDRRAAGVGTRTGSLTVPPSTVTEPLPEMRLVTVLSPLKARLASSAIVPSRLPPVSISSVPGWIDRRAAGVGTRARKAPTFPCLPSPGRRGSPTPSAMSRRIRMSRWWRRCSPSSV